MFNSKGIQRLDEKIAKGIKVQSSPAHTIERVFQLPFKKDVNHNFRRFQSQTKKDPNNEY